jgi:hypothetical protein
MDKKKTIPAYVVRLVGVERHMVSSQSHLHGWGSLDRFDLGAVNPGAELLNLNR